MQKKKKRIVFLSGAITSRIRTYQYAFSEAQMVLEYMGYIVLNPAWMPIGMPLDAYREIDDAMLLQSDMICMLPGWEKSPGARRERDIAIASGIKSIEYQDIDIFKWLEEGRISNVDGD